MIEKTAAAIEPHRSIGHSRLSKYTIQNNNL